MSSYPMNPAEAGKASEDEPKPAVPQKPPFRNRRCVGCGQQFTTREPNRVTCQNCPAPKKKKPAKKAGGDTNE